MTVIAIPPCAQCGGRRLDEYTHYGCPDSTSDQAHRHWVCVTCSFEFSTSSEVQEAAPPSH
jgi:hypothetical protein